MPLRSFGVLGLLICVSGCSQPAREAGSEHRSTATPHVSVAQDAHLGTLTARERSWAARIARREQRKVVGTFVGATAFATRGTPFDPGEPCDLDKRFIDIRLVWSAGANFVHSHTPGSPPDGPRKDLLMTVDPANGHVCQTGAGYRDVGAGDDETLLYGQWPDPADG
ncbi:hypothetical protein ACVW00_003193 [Marmoricola sp. URHA0025 HA25]